MTFEAANIGSIDCWGIAAWPPFPLIFASKKPLPANNGPDLEATSPIGKSGAICNPNIAVTFSNAPASKIFLAPPPPSSAGWKTRTTVPLFSQQNEEFISNPWEDED
jgi:hypothetical protein